VGNERRRNTENVSNPCGACSTSAKLVESVCICTAANKLTTDMEQLRAVPANVHGGHKTRCFV